MTLTEARKERAEIITSLKSLRDKSKAENRDLTAEEFKAVKDGLTKTEKLDAEINQLEEVEATFNEIDQKAEALTKSAGRKSNPEKAVTSGLKERSGDDKNRGFKGMGEFGQKVAEAYNKDHVGAIDERLRIGAAVTGQGQTVGADGGFLIPPGMAAGIWDGMAQEVDNLMMMCDQYTVEGESLEFVANAETSRASGSRFGAMNGYWLSEAAQVGQGKVKFRKMKLEPHQLGALIYCTEKLLRNSPIALEQYLNKAASAELTFMCNDAIINGNGVGKPKGILTGTPGTDSCRVKITKEQNQGAATIVKPNIDKMWARCHRKSRANAVWLVNQDIEPELENLSQVVGTGGVPVYLPAGGIQEAPNARLKGRPVIPIEFCSTLGTEGDIILADLRAYALGVKGAIEMAMSMHLRFDYAEQAFRFLTEVDGQPWLVSPITPFKGSNTLSPFVTLETRS